MRDRFPKKKKSTEINLQTIERIRAVFPSGSSHVPQGHNRLKAND